MAGLIFLNLHEAVHHFMGSAIPAHGNDRVITFFGGLSGKFDGMAGIDCAAPGEFAFEFCAIGRRSLAVFQARPMSAMGLRMSFTLRGMTRPDSGLFARGFLFCLTLPAARQGKCTPRAGEIA